MHRKVTLVLLGVVVSGSALLHAAGCNDDPGLAPPKEAGLEEIAVVDSGLECVTDPPVMQWLDTDGTLKDGDWSCYAGDAGFVSPFADAADDADGALDDAATDAADDAADAADAATPDAGSPLARFHLNDFTSLGPVPETDVDIFYGNTVIKGGAAVAPDFTGTTASLDAGASGSTHAGPGEFLFAPPSTSVFAYRISARTRAPALKTVIQFDNPTPRPGTVFLGNSLTEASFTLLGAGILGSAQPVPGTSLIVTSARDCQDHEIRGGIIELVDDATGEVIVDKSGAQDIRLAYFNTDRFPDLRCRHTVAQQSLWVAENVPNSRSWTIRVLGRMTASDVVPKLIGTRKIELLPDSIMIPRAYRLAKK